MTAPAPAEVAEVDAGVNDELVDAEAEPRDPDEYVAGLQNDRDRCAARGDFARAAELNQRVQELRAPTLDDREVGA